MPPRPARRRPTDPASRLALTADGWSGAAVDRARTNGDLVRLLPGTYVAPQTATAPYALLDAAVAHLGEGVAVLGTAARLHGLPTPWPDDGLTHVALRPGREQVQRPGLRFHTWKLRTDETTTIDGRAVTSLERTVADLMCLTDRLSAVAAVDHALHHRLLTPADVRRLQRTTRRRRGAARSREWWLEADGRAESPLETRARLRAVDGGYRPDAVQLELALDGRTLRGDLAWRMTGRRWLVLEADGHDVHDQPDALFRDRWRSNALQASGRVVIARVVWRDTVRRWTIPRLLSRYLGPPRYAVRDDR